MKEIVTDKGLLKISRNLGVLGTAGFVLLSAGFATGAIETIDPVVKYIACSGLVLNAGIAGSMTYDIHKQLKKTKVNL